MSRVAYVNGRYLPISDPSIPVEDRGLQFADSVYEVVLINRGKPVDEEPHMERLERSLGELRIPAPMSRAAIGVITREMVRRNKIVDGIVYMQVTRGTAPRNAAPMRARTAPTVIMTARRVTPLNLDSIAPGIAIKTVPDIRWRRRDIKTTNLLPNAMAKQQALDAGFSDAWMTDEVGHITEGSSSNAWIVTANKQLITRQPTEDILWGVTRRRTLALAKALGLTFIERSFSVTEAKEASEAFLTSASSYIMPVTKIDDKVIGNGHAGSVTIALAEGYHAFMVSGETS